MTPSIPAIDIGAYEHQESSEKYEAVKDSLRKALADVGGNALVLIALMAAVVEEHRQQPVNVGDGGSAGFGNRP